MGEDAVMVVADVPGALVAVGRGRVHLVFETAAGSQFHASFTAREAVELALGLNRAAVRLPIPTLTEAPKP